MTWLVDTDIRDLCTGETPMISPFSEEMRQAGMITYGLSSAGYDVRLDGVFKFPKPSGERILSPLPMKMVIGKDDKELEYYPIYQWETVETMNPFLIPAHSFVLGKFVERFCMPLDVIGVGTLKSTYARCGIAVHLPPLEPGWEGEYTVAIYNQTGNPVALYPHMGFCQLTFHRLTDIPEKTYRDKQGRYQNSTGIQGAAY